MLERIESTISRYNMIPAGIRLGVAVSGGADSVFLLRFLAERGGNRLTALHVNHGLRGEESEGDCEFVRELAKETGAEFSVWRMGPAEGNLEQFCRRARQGFFGRMMAEGRVERVATGHTASDQAETVLMRLLRGAGTTGLRGVLPVTREGLVRPLLSVGREEVRDWLRGRNLGWREDESNRSETFLRNRIRAKLAPVMRELDADYEAALGRVAELAWLDERYWERETAAVLDGAGSWESGGLVLDCRKLAALPPALLGRVVRAGMERAFGSLRRVDRGHVERVGALVTGERGEGAVEVPGGRVERSLDWVRMGGEAAGETVERAIPGEWKVGERLVRARLGDGYTEGDATELDWERLRPPLRLRGWRGGDRVQAVGRDSGDLVKEFFARQRIPSWERWKWPIITDSDGIVWVYRLGAAARAAAGPGTRIRLQVRCDTVSSK